MNGEDGERVSWGNGGRREEWWSGTPVYSSRGSQAKAAMLYSTTLHHIALDYRIIGPTPPYHGIVSINRGERRTRGPKR